MVTTKVKASIVAAIAILAVVIVAFIPIGESSATVSNVSNQTTTGLGEFNVYFMINSDVNISNTEIPSINGLSEIKNQWVGFKGDGSDGYIATKNVLDTLGFTSASYSFDANFATSSSGYVTNNVNYGSFTKLMNLTPDGTNSWYMYVYQTVTENNITTSTWNLTTTALGLYQPFNDWVDGYKTANVALYYGPSTVSSYPVTIMPLTEVPTSATGTNADKYAVSFTFNYVGPKTYAGYNYEGIVTETAVGYGSNAWSALKNALNVNPQSPAVTGGDNYSNLGWLTTMKGLSSERIHGEDTPAWEDDVYVYWNLYYYSDSNATSPGFVYSNFTTGFYCPLEGSAQQCDNFLFVYA